MKVIAVDSLNRDYKPERLITVSVTEEEATIIAEALNKKESELYYRVMPDRYKLNLDSMFDLAGVEAPDYFYIQQYGLKALACENGIDKRLNEM